MVRNSDIQVIFVVVVIFLTLFFRLETEANPKKTNLLNDLTQINYTEYNSSVDYILPQSKENNKQLPAEITCPEDIYTYTDINSCSSYISGALNVQFAEGSVTQLRWEMTGATIDESGKTGINQINNYSFNEGETTVTYTIEDNNSYVTTCSFTVTIWDNQVPRLENVPGDITVTAPIGECSAIVDWREPTASDNCSLSSEIQKEASINPGSNFPIGKTIVYYHAIDAMGNKSVNQSFTVTVLDNEPPQLLLPKEITINCEDEIPASWQMLQQLITAGGAAFDNCEIDETSFQLLFESTDAESCPFTITRTYEISDIHGNASVAEFLIHVAASKNEVKQEIPVLKSAAADPTIDIDNGESTTICIGSSVNLTTTVTGDPISSYSWSPSEGLSDASISTPTASPTSTTIYTVTVTDVNGLTASDNITIIVNPDNTITLSSASGTDNQSVCINNTLTDITYTTTGATGATFSGLPAGINGNWASNTATISGTPTVSGTYNYTVALTGGCGNETESGTIIVNPVPTVVAPADQTFCNNQTTAPISVSGTPAGVVFDISGGTAVGLSDQINVTQIPSFTTSTGTVTISVTPKINGCTGSAQTFTITVEDVTPPVISACPNNISKSATSGKCETAVSWTQPTATDDCTSPGNLIWTSNYTPGEIFPIGTTTVNYTVTDEVGLQSTCSFDITITDNEDPVINCPSNITAVTDAGSCNATVSVIANANDNCPSLIVTNDFNTGGANASGLYPIGITTVTFTATDASGNFSECSVNITVQDNEDPVITCTGNITQEVDAGTCEANVTNVTASFTDNCTGGSISNSYNTNGADASGTYPIGTTNVMFTATDAAGNKATCSVVVTITDNQSPVISCPGNITQTADAGKCEAYVNVPLATISDNCTGGVIINNYNSGGANASGIYPVGTTTVEFTATDATGNASTCSIDITITDDEAPVPDNSTLSDVYGDVCAETNVTPPNATDNCAGTITATTTDATSFTELGDYSIHWIYDDGNGNTSSQDQLVHITSSGAPVPTIANLPAINGQCSVEITPAMYPTATSSCGAPVTGGTLDPLLYTTQGTYEVTWVYFSIGGITLQTQAVIVEDTESPVFDNCPSDIPATADAGTCGATISGLTVSATDNCSTVTITNDFNSNGADASGNFPVGTTTVTFTATDEVGNYSTCTVNVTVTDDEAPAITDCPLAPITQSADPGDCEALVTLPVINATDNCSTVTITNDFNSGGANATGIYPLGTTTVIFTATDESGNSTTCSVDITITDDQAPALNCPANITQAADPGVCEAFVTVPVPTFVENCSNASITNDYNNTANASDTYPLGNTTVNFTATDDAGNISASCSVTITVVDNEPPVKPPLAPIFETCSVTLAAHPAPTTTDNCDGVITGTTTTSFPITYQGLTTIVWTFTDSNGNYTTANQQVNIDDNTSPIWDNPSFFTSIVNLQCGDDTSPSNTGLPTATDNCTPVTINYTDNVTPGSCPGANTILRTWTAADENGNANTKTQTMYVTDNTKPVVICRDTTVANPDEIFDPYKLEGISFSDNCGIDTVFLVDEQLIFTENGTAGFCPEEVIRQYVVYDQCGNVSNTCTQTITVSSPGTCAVCQEDVPYRLANLDGAPDSTWVLNEKDLTREGACCQGVDGNTAWGCMSINVYLDEDAVGLIFTVEKPAPSGVEYYRIDCGPMTPLGDMICLAGGHFYTLTFCKPGEDKPIYTIQSIAGAVTPDSLTTRADVECFGDLHVSGLDPATINWSVKYPSGASDLLRYLDTTDIENPIFTPDSITPALIIYEVCGTLLGSPECDGNPIVDCADVIVNVLPPIKINLDVDVTAICENEIPPIHAEIPNMDPNLTYTFKWFNGPDGTGTIVSTDPEYQPTDVGTYSVLVTEVTSGVGCNSDLTNFNIAYDIDGPSVLAPPDTLFVDCSVLDFDEQVVAWLALAEAHETEDPSLNVQVNNDYTFISPSCGLTQVVHFTAQDNCGNISRDSAVIYVADDIDPVINVEASDVIIDCSTIDPDENPDYLAWLAAHGGASATDDCDNNLTWSADTATAVWVGNGKRDSITVTFTVSDDCGNTDATTATFTVVDDEPPTINCLGDFEEIIAQELCSSTISMDTVSSEDLCSIPVLTWVMSGATTKTGSGQVVDELFNVGKTTVKFTATDDGGLTDTCSFQVWVKHPDFPTDAITCPADSVWANADPLNCNASIILGTVTINDPCNEIDAVWNDSPYATSPTDASGNYPIGVTDFSWYITDVSGNRDTCKVTVVVKDVDAPEFLTCPADTLEDIVDAGACDMTNFNLVDPTWDVGCGASLRYELSGATTGSGSDLIDPAVVSFNVGITTITYILEDPSENADTCIFWAWAKHVDFPTATITCPTDTVRAIADSESCDAGLTLGTVTFTDPCNEIDSIWNDSPYASSWSDASGNYPIGTTDFAWYILDVSGNTDTCDVTVIVQDLDAPQFMSCPSDTLEDIISAADCDMTNFNLVDPTWDVGCGASLRYELSGATTGSGTDLIDPSVVTFNVGITTITYILEDPSENADTCIFWAWVKRVDFPSATYNCPQPLWTVDADTDSCNATLTLDKLEIISDPCNEIDSVWNDSPAVGATAADASGTYDIGSTTFNWYVRDVSNNVDTCKVTVIVNDLLPTLECPIDTIVQADFEVPYKDGVTLELPIFYDNCPDSVLTYTIEEPDGNVVTSGTTGINLVPNPRRYQLGVTTITYTFTDAHGHELSCDFTVTVLGEPEIDCPPIDTLFADANCIFAVDPGVPTLLEGIPPIDWTWTITEPDGTVTTGNSTGNAPDPSPEPIGIYDFPLGTTTIEWIAKNVSGADTCSHTITVIDTVPPTFSSAPIQNCVDLLYIAVYDDSNPNPNVGVDPNLSKNPSPDYYTFTNGNISLDVTDLDDNCCDPSSLIIYWQIDFTATPDPLNPTGPSLTHTSISGTGQPSTYGSDMQFPGDGVYFTNITHTITYRVEDCNGNISEPQVQNIVVTPRPQIIKTN